MSRNLRLFRLQRAPPQNVRETQGSNFKTDETRRQLIFLRSGSVIRNDLLPTDIEAPVKNEIAFEGGNQIDRLACDSEAQFAATRGGEGTRIAFFELKSISSDHCR